MAYTATNTQAPGLSFKPFFGWSVFLHVLLTALMLAGVYIGHSAVPWGGVGDDSSSDVKVNLVSSAGIPMPRPIIPTDNATVDPTKGLYKEEPPKPPELPKDAVAIPKFNKEKPPPPPSKASKIIENKTPPPPNAVPYGKSGQMDLPTGYGNAPGPLNGGMTVQGAGGGEFAARYPWYVESVRKRISDNWLQNTIDPSVRAARTAHAIVTFTIMRDGTVKNIRLDTSSGNRSMDDSATRAMLSIDKMPQLPSDWRSNSVDVMFDFDLGRH
ncbi:MAG TPA: energy transducer TonB [Candidatus Acidoferrum sp.]|jgi:protein TonB